MNQPDRSPPQSEIRAVEILEGVRLAFAEKGFDGASMQDLARACGMSVGNFYRYFPSKAAIVAALVTRDLAEVEEEFSKIIESDDPMRTLRDALRFRIEEDQCTTDGQLWAEVTAASLRKPEIAEITYQMETEVGRYLCIVFARVKGISFEEALAIYGAHASLLVMMVKSSAMHRSQTPQAQEDLTALIIRTLNRILDEIVRDDVKG
ncbi:MAG: TetR/AcrR family transcriptional regulator [Rhodobacteraceae bacterium]|nr:TetR/AcrR family transcriptional regulator [Paracoccaceae bacterium]MCZ8334124.1 TetR/AcrR family transcriptional regulator [Paracoccaceae bacterium]